ncbi:MAG: DUF2804 domain-containing protein [Promethearchaeota archaeon]
MQNEIKKPSPLLDSSGSLVQAGWARHPILQYNPENAKGRLKEWDYYCVLDHEKRVGVALTFADLRVMGLFNVVWLDFNSKEFVADEEVKLFTRGKLGMPLSSTRGDCKYEGKKLKVEFRRLPDRRLLQLEFPGFGGGTGISVDLSLEQDGDKESIVVATPWPRKKKAFYYNEKVNCLPATGTVTLGGVTHEFTPGSSWGVLDWGRGVWPYRNRWYWGSFSGKDAAGSPIGWNIGYGFGDLSTHTENAVFRDGRIHKLDEVTFHFDPDDYYAPWEFTSNDGRFEMSFEPLLDRNSTVNLLVFKSVQHQVFGLYTGDAVLDDGTKVHVDRGLGFAEDVYNRW